MGPRPPLAFPPAFEKPEIVANRSYQASDSPRHKLKAYKLELSLKLPKLTIPASRSPSDECSVCRRKTPIAITV